jgi:SAM-dependent methyltransferase
VTGCKGQAASGELNFIVGGEAAVLEGVHPALAAMGKTILHVGPSGSGTMLLPDATNSMDAVFMSFTLELFDTAEIPRVLRECKWSLQQGGRMVVVGMSKDTKHDPLIGAFEWTHEHFPDFLDCRPMRIPCGNDAGHSHRANRRIEQFALCLGKFLGGIVLAAQTRQIRPLGQRLQDQRRNTVRNRPEIS